MQLTKQRKKELITASVFFGLAVILGAFGAHGLKEVVSEKAMQTYQTGIQYQFLHAIALFILAILSQLFELHLIVVKNLFIVGIILFSFNCYFYAISSIKLFAMIVPLGGVSFVIGWVVLVTKLVRQKT